MQYLGGWFLLGIILSCQLTALPAWYAVCALILLSLMLAQYRMFVLLCGLFYAVLIGQWQMRVTLPDQLENQKISITAPIEQMPQWNKDTLILRVISDSWQVGSQSGNWRMPVKLYWYHAKTTPIVGTTWQFAVKLKKPHGLSNPPFSNSENAAWAQGIRAQGYIISGEHFTAVPSAPFYLNIISHLRQNLYQHLKQSLEREPLNSILMALILGVQSEITSEQWHVFQRTGTSHLVAISGLHVSMVAGFMMMIVDYLLRHLKFYHYRIPKQMICAASGAAIAAFYALMSGLATPSLRASTMLLTLMLAVALRRSMQAWQVYSVALTHVLIWQPFSILTPSFALSFAAVGLLIFSQYMRDKGWRRMLRVQTLINLGLIPLTIYFFGQISWMSFVTNFIAIPWLEILVLPLALLAGCLLSLNATLAHALLQISCLLLTPLWYLLTWFAHFSWSISLYSLPMWQLLISVIGVLWFFLPLEWYLRVLGIVIFIPIFLTKTQTLAENTMRVTILDVGQGLSVVCQTAHHILLYDTGSKGLGGDMGERVLIPYLHYLQVVKLDKLLISHGDNDHFGGASSLLKAYPAAEILTSVPARLQNYPQTKACEQGQHWQWDGVDFRILAPQPHSSLQGNNRCCVLKIQFGKHSVLLPGDIEHAAEEALLASQEAIASEILVAPHHGSKTSSTFRFIERVKPQYVVYPTGYYNRFHHPHPLIVARYKKQNAIAFQSDRCGALEFILKANNNAVVHNCYREQTERFWQER